MKNTQVKLIPFESLGEYRLHFHHFSTDSNENVVLSSPKPIHCSIRNDLELRTEHIELHLNEELHASAHLEAGILEETPLIRLNEFGLWLWQKKQGIWWPLRQAPVSLTLDSQKRIRVRTQ